MKATVEQWLQRIADPVVRESAVRQMDKDDKNKERECMADAILWFTFWEKTKEGKRLVGLCQCKCNRIAD